MPITFDLATTGGRGPMHLCRDLIEAGTNPSALVAFVRGTTPVFAPTPARWWAERRVREADQSGPIRITRDPFYKLPANPS